MKGNKWKHTYNNWRKKSTKKKNIENDRVENVWCASANALRYQKQKMCCWNAHSINWRVAAQLPLKNKLRKIHRSIKIHTSNLKCEETDDEKEKGEAKKKKNQNSTLLTAYVHTHTHALVRYILLVENVMINIRFLWNEPKAEGEPERISEWSSGGSAL